MNFYVDSRANHGLSITICKNLRVYSLEKDDAIPPGEAKILVKHDLINVNHATHYSPILETGNKRACFTLRVKNSSTDFGSVTYFV
jgi:hypothetical protein